MSFEGLDGTFSGVLDLGSIQSIMNPYKMRVKRLHSDAKIPEKAHSTDLGYDLFCSFDVELPPRSVTLVDTGICIGFPLGYGGLLRDRSSVSTKRGLFVVAGVIDQAYRGQIKVAMYNSNDTWDRFTVGDKIAQMLLYPVISAEAMEVDELDETDRGAGGFGSTGSR